MTKNVFFFFKLLLLSLFEYYCHSSQNQKYKIFNVLFFFSSSINTFGVQISILGPMYDEYLKWFFFFVKKSELLE